MKKFVTNIFVVIYLLVVIFITFCLLSYNDKGVTIINNKALIIGNSFMSNSGDLLIVDINSLNINKGDYVYYYDVNDGKNIVNGGIVNIVNDSNKNDIAYTIDNNRTISSDDVIGTKKGSSSYEVIGGILSFLESKWGYLLVVVFPIMIAFIYEVYMIIREIGRKQLIIMKRSFKDVKVDKKLIVVLILFFI